MGGDGGSLPQRADMVRTKGYVSSQKSGQGSMGFHPNSFVRAAAEVVDKRTSRRLKMTTCALSNEPLGKHVMASRAGYLFNKEIVLKKLLELKSGGESFFSDHVTGLRDLLNIKLVPVCPITKKDLLDGSVQVVAMEPCGCVLSQKALDVAAKATDTCLACNQPVEMVIKLTPEEEEFVAQLEVARTKKSVSSSKKHKAGGSSDPSGVQRMKKRAIVDPERSDAFKKIFHA